MIKEKNVAGDIEGRRRILECIPNGIVELVEIGPANKPLHPDAWTVDIEPKWNPDMVASQDNLSFADNSIEMIIASHVLEHTENTRKTLNEWMRILVFGGKIAICVPHGEDVNWETLGTSDLTHEQLFTEKTLELYLKHAGFKNVRVETYERPYAYKNTRGIFAYAEK